MADVFMDTLTRNALLYICGAAVWKGESPRHYVERMLDTAIHAERNGLSEFANHRLECAVKASEYLRQHNYEV